jgi:hypothetical protein
LGAWHRGHFCTATAGAVLWVLRARFLRFEVRRFGTAMDGQMRKVKSGAEPERAPGISGS